MFRVSNFWNFFVEGAPVFVEGEGGACAMAQWHNGQSKSVGLYSGTRL